MSQMPKVFLWLDRKPTHLSHYNEREPYLNEEIQRYGSMTKSLGSWIILVSLFIIQALHKSPIWQCHQNPFCILM